MLTTNLFNEVMSMREAIDRLFSESFVRPSALIGALTRPMTVPFDLYETGDQVFIRAAVPGADPNQITIAINQGVLTIRGYRTLYPAEMEKQATWHVRGLSEGEFQLQVTLPVPVDAEKAEATYENGILTVCLPKAEAVRAKRIAIKGVHEQQALPAGAR